MTFTKEEYMKTLKERAKIYYNIIQQNPETIKSFFEQFNDESCYNFVQYMSSFENPSNQAPYMDLDLYSIIANSIAICDNWIEKAGKLDQNSFCKLVSLFGTSFHYNISQTEKENITELRTRINEIELDAEEKN